MSRIVLVDLLFFFNDTATTEIYTLSLHDALPISELPGLLDLLVAAGGDEDPRPQSGGYLDDERRHPAPDARHDDGLEIGRAHVYSSHANISYAVFCLKKKKNIIDSHRYNTSASY